MLESATQQEGRGRPRTGGALGQLHDAFIGTMEQLRRRAAGGETDLLRGLHLHVAEIRAELRAAGERAEKRAARAEERYERIYELLAVNGEGGGGELTSSREVR